MAGGKGTPWGPTTYGAPQAPNIMTDPSQVATPGMDQEINQVRTAAGQAQGRGNNAALAALQRAGVAGGSEAGNALGNVAAETALGEGQAMSGLQQQQFGEQLGLLGALNQAQEAKYGQESYNNLGESAQREGALSGIGSGIGSLAGLAYLFGRPGGG